MSDLNLGNIISGPAARDAIHIAVAPVRANALLPPGIHVGLVNEDTACCSAAVKIGVVDPFLTSPVRRGQRFWLFLYPNTITALRHEWTHPAFGGDPAKGASEMWLRRWARDEADGLSYEEVMAAARSFVRYGEYLCQGGRFEGYSVPEEFWVHYEVVTGERVSESDRGTFFTCSC